MHFGSTLRLLRTDAGISLRTLAQAVGVSSAYLSRVENGHDSVPTPDRLVAIARVLGLSPPVLLELAHKVTPFVASYLERVPTSGALFTEIARRDLTGAQLARIRAFIDDEFPAEAPQGKLSVPRLSTLLDVERIIVRLSCSDLEDAVDVAASRLVSERDDTQPSRVAEAILQREREASSALGEGVCVPHALFPKLSQRAALVTLARPLPSPTPDGVPIRLLIVLMLDAPGPRQLELLSQVARLATPGCADELTGIVDARKIVRYVEAAGL